jgi:hypothetical protein
MIHGIVLGWFGLHEKYFESWALWQKVACSAILCLLLAKITYQLFETRCQNFLIKLSKGNYQRPSMLSGNSMIALSKLPTIEILITLMIIGCLGIATKFWRSNYNPISSAHAREMIVKENFQVQNILFGNQFYLRASKQFRDEKGLHLTLLWESTRRQRLDYLTNVTLLDKAGGHLSSEAYPQSSSLAVVKAGKMWLENIDLEPPNTSRRRIGQMLISVLGDKDERLYVQNGARDATNRQFVLAQSE